MTDHHELISEMPSVERMATQDRLKHARKRRSQQLKKWTQYEKHLDKEQSKKKKSGNNAQIEAKKQKRKKRNVIFVPNISLLEAAARNDVAEVRSLLEQGVKPDLTNDDGLTAIHQCCIDDSEEMLLLLLEYGANVNAQDSEHWTPLHAAATCGHAHLCKHLIDRGADLLAVNADGNMPYDICEDEMTLDYIETEMAKRGITQEDIDDKRLASEKYVLEDLEKLKAANKSLEFKDHVGATPLHIAAANGYLQVAQYLLDNHVSVNIRDNDSWQPIHAAAYWGQPDLVDLLVQHGADIDAKTKNGETPFDLCEDPELKQKILDVKDEIETNRASKGGKSAQIKHRISSRSASLRRSSLRGDKGRLFLKEAKEEALHFGLRSLQDEEDLKELDEDKENVPATNIDDVELILNLDDDSKHNPLKEGKTTHHNEHHKSKSSNQPHSTKSSHPETISQPKQTNKSQHPPTDSRNVKPSTTTSSTSSKSHDTRKSSENQSKPTVTQPKPQMTTIQVVTPKQQPAPAKQQTVPSKQQPAPPKQQTAPTKQHQPANIQPNNQSGQTNSPPRQTGQANSPPKQNQPGQASLQKPQTSPKQQTSSSSENPNRAQERQGQRQSLTPSNNSGSTLTDLKRHRAENRKDNLDAHVQSMFVERANNWHSSYSNPSNNKTSNGHNNNNTYTQETVKRYVAPSNVAIVGEEEKTNCCVVM